MRSERGRGYGQTIPDEEPTCEIHSRVTKPTTRIRTLQEEELMAKDKPRREAKKPKKKAPKSTPTTQASSVLPSQPPRS